MVDIYCKHMLGGQGAQEIDAGPQRCQMEENVSSKVSKGCHQPTETMTGSQAPTAFLMQQPFC